MRTNIFVAIINKHKARIYDQYTYTITIIKSFIIKYINFSPIKYKIFFLAYIKMIKRVWENIMFFKNDDESFTVIDL